MGEMVNMQREIEAAKILRAQLSDICANDPDFLRDTIEGETNVRELIAALVAEEGEDKAIIEGIDSYVEGLKARKDRLKGRIETRRALLASALEIAELKAVETPTGTVSLSKVSPKAIITDEAEIPTRFWKAAAPTLDRKGVLDALKAGDSIPGATLSNAGVTTTIRRS